MYYYDPKENNSDNILLNTVEENLMGYMQVEIDIAKIAKKAYHKLGAPGMRNFQYLINGNMINNCPIMHHDVDNMIKIWGKDVAALKGKSSRRTPRKVVEEIFEVPAELKEKVTNITLCVDIMYIEGETFLTGIGLPIRFRFVGK